MEEQLKKNALYYHSHPQPGKISVVPTKSLSNQIDLSLAYSPGVAYACEAIVDDPLNANLYTSRSNLVGVITNGTAVLGLGNIGPLAAKPVMEGKGCLFKAFAGIDVFDIELNESDPDKLIDAIAMLEPTLGGINLEDIKAPECFYIEKALRERMRIPVFHDDQHGTAIISTAAIINSLKIVNKKIEDVKLVCSGAGAAAIACLNLLVSFGLRKENILLLDSKGVVTTKRQNLDETKQLYAAKTTKETLHDALIGADIFLGCSAAGVLKPDMLEEMAPNPLILALANPEPEIRPELAKKVRPDCIIATGRSDYPNQVNNVLCFPFIFRGALDVGATAITEGMKRAAVIAIAELARDEEQSEEVIRAYNGQVLTFSADYIIPKPFDPRLITHVAPAVAKAAMEDGVATRPLADLDDYRNSLRINSYRTGMLMRPVFQTAKQKQAKVIFAEGEEPRVFHAIQFLVNERLVRPILIGRTENVLLGLRKIGSHLKIGEDFEIIDPHADTRMLQWSNEYLVIANDPLLTLETAREKLVNDSTLFGSLLVRNKIASGMICGLTSSYKSNLTPIRHIFNDCCSGDTYAAMNLLLLEKSPLFITDTFVNELPNAEQLADIAILASEEIEKLGMKPTAAFVSFVSSETEDSDSAVRIKNALEIVKKRKPDLNIDGPISADLALSEKVRQKSKRHYVLEGNANVLIMPNREVANVAYNVLKVTGSDGITIGPFLLGCSKSVHIMTRASTVRRIINMATVVSANT